MGDTKSLTNDKAIEKIKELADGQVCIFCTFEDGKIASRPMSTQTVDEDGTVWFMSDKHSEKNKQLSESDTVYLMYSDPGKQHYLSLSGNATIVYDRQKIKELWNPIAKAWFEEGKDDPNISLIKITPTDGHYWDTKNGKLVAFIKMAVAAVAGGGDDGGIEGDLKI